LIGIRVDVNKEIATGHIMRCMTIANKLKQSSEVLFITSEEGYKMLDSFGYQALMLNNHNNIEDELTDLHEIIMNKNINKLLVDSYSVTFDYLSYLNKLLKLIYIDDLNLFTYPVQMLINYSPIFADFKYQDNYHADQRIKFLLGLKYVPLRDEFNENRKLNTNESVSSIFISSGGADVCSFLNRIIPEILTSPKIPSNIKIKVMSGKYVNQSAVFQSPRVMFYQNINNVAELMSSCDIAITACGTTLYELCACQVPAISYIDADNQIYDAVYFSKHDWIPYVGDIRNNYEKCIYNILESIKTYSNNYELRKERASMLSALVDGLGASRIADAIRLL